MSAAPSISAVAYLRTDTTNAAEESMAAQRSEIEKLARCRGYKIIRWYDRDIGVSGADSARTDFQKLIADAQQLRDFQVVLCWDLDRFGRFSPVDAGQWIQTLREAGVRLETVTKGEVKWESFLGIVHSVAQRIKGAILRDLSRNVVRGKAHALATGRYARGVAPFGFDRVFYDAAGKEVYRRDCRQRFATPEGWSVRLEPSQDVAAVELVQWIFRTFDQTGSVAGIAKQLRASGAKLPRGGKWTCAAVNRILSLRAYAGDTEIGRHRCGKYFQLGDDLQVAPAVRRERKPVTVIKDTHRGIVDRALFLRVQRKRRLKRCR